MKINGINIPTADNRGRAFPYKQEGPQYCGPCVINGKELVVKVWINKSSVGNTYLRMVFESFEENPHLITSSAEE